MDTANTDTKEAASAISSNQAVEASGLVKVFGATRAVDGVDLAVPTGSVHGFLGPNGAGKTTTIRVLATLLRPRVAASRPSPRCSHRSGATSARRRSPTSVGRCRA